MNRSELVEAISNNTGLSKRDSEAALSAFVEEVTAGVKAGDDVRVTGFGTFKLRQHATRTGRNPRTGEAVKIKASKSVAFVPGATLKADVNKPSRAKRS